MAVYLEEAEMPEAMNVWLSRVEPEPLKHTIWTGDFMGLAKHNIACPVCFNRHAMLERDVTPGRYREEFQPCTPCSEKGWRVIQLPRWLRWLAKR